MKRGAADWRGVHVLGLRGDGGQVTLVPGLHVLRCRTSTDTAGTSVVADAVYGDIIDDSVVGIVNVGDVNIVYSGVVVELVVLPAATLVSVAEVTEAVVDPAIKADDWPPIACGEEEAGAVPSPVARRPKITGHGSEHPCAGDPVVIAEVRIPGPIARDPDVSRCRTRWLNIHG